MTLAILEQHLRGPTQDCINRFPFAEASYELILQERFGEDQIMFDLEAIENLSTIKRLDVVGLRKFYDDLIAHVEVLES